MNRTKRFFSKFVTSQPGKQVIAIHILLNISKSKGNQTIKFGQLTEFCHSENVAEKLFPDPFLKKQN